MLHIVSSQPPHCRVIAGNKPRAIVQGRENVFQAIAVFLFYVKEEENVREHGVVAMRCWRSSTHLLLLMGWLWVGSTGKCGHPRLDAASPDGATWVLRRALLHGIVCVYVFDANITWYLS